MRSIILLTFLLLAGCATTPDPKVAQMQQQITALQSQVDTINKNLDYTHRVAVGANKKAASNTTAIKATKQAAAEADENADEAKTAVKTLFEQLPLPPVRPVYTEHE